MESVEVEVVIHLLVSFNQIILPLGITRIHKIDAALPATRKRMGVLVFTTRLLIQVPFFLDSIRTGVIKDTECKVIEHSLHSIAVLHIYILLHCCIIDITVGDILIDLVKFLHCASKRPMVLVVPVIELHAVDMTAVQELHFSLYHAISELILAKITNEAIPREHRPVA